MHRCVSTFYEVILDLTIHTWEEQQRSFTGPVEKERELMRTLFSIVYLVVAALILSIFWSIVFEKTRDIGILQKYRRFTEEASCGYSCNTVLSLELLVRA